MYLKKIAPKWKGEKFERLSCNIKGPIKEIWSSFAWFGITKWTIFTISLNELCFLPSTNNLQNTISESVNDNFPETRIFICVITI